MSHYYGIDLHSNNHVVVVIDQEDKRVYEKRLRNDLNLILEALVGFRKTLQAVAVESTFNWYWLVDGRQEAGILVKLVNPAAVKQYDSLKYSNDQHDAFWLAHLMRLGILPTGYIYPKAQRAVRDLLGRRLFLVRSASSQLISGQSQIWRSTGIRIATGELKKTTFQIPLAEGYTVQAIQAGLTVYRAIQQEIQQLEQSAFNAVKLSDQYTILQTTTGIGKILGLTALCWKRGIFIALQDPATTHRIVVVSTVNDAARQQEERQWQREGGQSIFVLGLFRSRPFCGPV